MFEGGGIMHYPEIRHFFTQSFPELLKPKTEYFFLTLVMANKKLPAAEPKPESYLHLIP